MYISFSHILIIVVISNLYFSLGGYLFLRSLCRAVAGKTGRKIPVWIYWPIAFLGLFLYFYFRLNAGGLRGWFGLMSSYWGIFLFIPFFIFSDIVCLGAFLLKAPQSFQLRIRAAALILIAGTFCVGSFSARSTKVTDYAVAVEKPLPQNSLRIILISDTHIGSLIRKKQFDKLVKKINALEGDIVLIAGDIIDRNLTVYRKEKISEEFSAIKATFGVYAVPGNHDFFGGYLEDLEKELAAAGVKLLIDEAVLLDDAFYIIGRNDFSVDRRGIVRKPLNELTEGLDASRLLILMDHQPVNLGEAEKAGIDLQVSGHTHRGQIWPASIITKRIYENHYGLLYKGKTAVIVTSGSGSWGPPLRIGTRSEIVRIELTSR